MKALFLDWDSIGNEFLQAAMKRAGIEVYIMDFVKQSNDDTRLNAGLAEQIIREIAEVDPDFLFSFNYFPVIAIACKACNKKYISWTYDSPFVQLYSNTIFYDTNYVFQFDRHECENLKDCGVKQIYYLPMAADAVALGKRSLGDLSRAQREICHCDVSFVGSMYNEKNKRLYYRLEGIDEYLQGYIDGIISAQQQVYGCHFIESMLTDPIIEKLQKYIDLNQYIDGFETLQWVYANYFIAQEVTHRERTEVMSALSKELGNEYCIKLFSRCDPLNLPNIHEMGPLDYYNHMPYAFKGTKINLNITVRSIQTGIPLRAFDIMGCEGFLLTNFQEDFLGEFVPGEDFVYYENISDLIKKSQYYLKHENERKQIAKSGFEKVREFHNFDVRLKTMLEIAFS